MFGLVGLIWQVWFGKLWFGRLQAIASFDSLTSGRTAVASCPQLWQLLEAVATFDSCYKLSIALGSNHSSFNKFISQWVSEWHAQAMTGPGSDKNWLILKSLIWDPLWVSWSLGSRYTAVWNRTFFFSVISGPGGNFGTICKAPTAPSQSWQAMSAKNLFVWTSGNISSGLLVYSNIKCTREKDK